MLIDQRLRDGQTIRQKYAGEGIDFRESHLANPLAVNLSVVTADRHIFIARRGKKTGVNEQGGLVPAVSGTGSPEFDTTPHGTYDPFNTAVRRLPKNDESLSSFTRRDHFLWLELRVRSNFFPFLFGEARIDILTSKELERNPPGSLRCAEPRWTTIHDRGGDILDRGAVLPKGRAGSTEKNLAHGDSISVPIIALRISRQVGRDSAEADRRYLGCRSLADEAGFPPWRCCSIRSELSRLAAASLAAAGVERVGGRVRSIHEPPEGTTAGTAPRKKPQSTGAARRSSVTPCGQREVVDDRLVPAAANCRCSSDGGSPCSRPLRIRASAEQRPDLPVKSTMAHAFRRRLTESSCRTEPGPSSRRLLMSTTSS